MGDNPSDHANQILLVEDSPSDAALTRKALARGRIRSELHHVKDGLQCMQFLRKEGAYAGVPRPDLILLDLNMPRMDGREALREIKSDVRLARIPVVVLTTSGEESDVFAAYDAHTNAYVVKPVDLNRFFDAVSQIEHFWFESVRLPAS
jgi:CheY-like chemotaxis protein